MSERNIAKAFELVSSIADQFQLAKSGKVSLDNLQATLYEGDEIVLVGSIAIVLEYLACDIYWGDSGLEGGSHTDWSAADRATVDTY